MPSQPAPPAAAPARYYLTTPIYYVNDTPHIGHAYTTIVADVMTRYHRMFGTEVRFLTGTDEHGQKVQRTAAARGVEPKAHCDAMAERFKAAFAKAGIAYDRFIRTTDPDHEQCVRNLLMKVWEARDPNDGEPYIYQSEYKGWYHIADETFVTKDEVKPEDLARGDVVELSEKNYFFRLEKYRQWLVDYIHANPSFILPETRANWVLGHLREPIADLCISRPRERLEWGIPLPFDEKYVCYVWFDALINYLTGVWRGEGRDAAHFAPWWPADCHLIGKDILQHHAIYWPIMLHALGLPLPRTILAHGWWMSGEAKISKREGQTSAAEALKLAADEFAATPAADRDARGRAAAHVMMASPARPAAGPGAWLWLGDEFGVDTLRYFLIREMALGNDSQISLELFAKRCNAELANDLGNLVSRATRILAGSFGGRIPPVPSRAEQATEFLALLDAPLEQRDAIAADLAGLLAAFSIHEIPARTAELVRELNVTFDRLQPWALAKEATPDALDRLALVLVRILELVAFAAVILYPIMPGRMAWLLRALGCAHEAAGLRVGSEGRLRTSAGGLAEPLLVAGATVDIGGQLFPRMDLVATAEKEIEAAGIAMTPSKGARPPKPGKATRVDAPSPANTAPPPPAAAAPATNAEGVAIIGIDDFARVQLRVAEVVAAERVEGADRLLKLRIRLGDEERPLIAGIAQFYAPESLVGRRIVVVANLKPAKIRGHESRGMLLAAKTGDRLTLVTTDDPAFPSNASVG